MRQSPKTPKRAVLSVAVEREIAAIVTKIAKGRGQTVSSALYDLLMFALLPALVTEMVNDPAVPAEKKYEAVKGAQSKYRKYAEAIFPNIAVMTKQIENLRKLEVMSVNELGSELQASIQ